MNTITSEKRQRLRKTNTLNPAPEKVQDPLFKFRSGFFDAHDLLQVRYELVRLVRVEHATLAEAAQRFGVSRPTCFRMTRAFDKGGLPGLMPAPRGPRKPHKISPEIVAFATQHRLQHGRIGARRLVPLIEQKFGVQVHPRSLEKALARQAQKKTPERSS